jgi:hypothetical protein
MCSAGRFPTALTDTRHDLSWLGGQQMAKRRKAAKKTAKKKGKKKKL